MILAGDPKQLGPIVFSHFANRLGFNKSMLVRLMERTLYRSDPEVCSLQASKPVALKFFLKFFFSQPQQFEYRYDPRLITRLVDNYRSIPSVMNVYNELFYDNDLKPMIDVNGDDGQLLKRLRRLLPNNRNDTEGVIFCNVKGKNQRNDDSPSWFNLEEAKKVSVATKCFLSSLFSLTFHLFR